MAQALHPFRAERAPEQRDDLSPFFNAKGKRKSQTLVEDVRGQIERYPSGSDKHWHGNDADFLAVELSEVFDTNACGRIFALSLSHDAPIPCVLFSYHPRWSLTQVSGNFHYLGDMTQNCPPAIHPRPFALAHEALA